MSTFRPSQYRLADSQFAVPDDLNFVIPALDLAIPIHPLFGPAMFRGLTTTQYNRLELPLRLATKMLYDFRAAFWIVTMMDGSLHEIDPWDNISNEIPARLLSTNLLDGKRLMRRTRPAPGTPAGDAAFYANMRRRSREILDNLTETLSEIKVASPGADGNFTRDSLYGLGSNASRNFPAAPSYQVDITLKEKTAFDFQHYPNDPFGTLSYHSRLARTLVHEIGHVVSTAAHGDRAMRNGDVFYNNYLCNEAGYNLEMILFGGLNHLAEMPRYYSNSPEQFTTLALEYPSKRFLNLYASAGDPIDQRLTMDRYFAASRFPMRFLVAMFTERFWRVDVPRMAGAIRPTPAATWIFATMEAGESFISESGYQIVVNATKTVPCSIADPTLSVRVQNKFRSIIAQDPNRP